MDSDAEGDDFDSEFNGMSSGEESSLEAWSSDASDGGSEEESNVDSGDDFGEGHIVDAVMYSERSRNVYLNTVHIL